MAQIGRRYGSRTSHSSSTAGYRHLALRVRSRDLNIAGHRGRHSRRLFVAASAAAEREKRDYGPYVESSSHAFTLGRDSALELCLADAYLGSVFRSIHKPQFRLAARVIGAVHNYRHRTQPLP